MQFFLIFFAKNSISKTFLLSHSVKIVDLTHMSLPIINWGRILFFLTQSIENRKLSINRNYTWIIEENYSTHLILEIRLCVCFLIEREKTRLTSSTSFAFSTDIEMIEKHFSTHHLSCLAARRRKKNVFSYLIYLLIKYSRVEIE